MTAQAATLSKQIRWAIGYRIAICLIFISIAVMVSAIFDFYNAYSQTKNLLKIDAQQLSEYIISQTLINNEEAISEKLKSSPVLNTHLHFTWHSTTFNHADSMPRWRTHFPWQYRYRVIDHDGNEYGFISISGNFFYDRIILWRCFTKLALLLFFSIIIFLLLKPLSRKIPEELFMAPIMDVLEVLRTRMDVKKYHWPLEFQEIQA